MQFGRDDKVPPLKLTVVQYAILGIFLVLAYGLWRLQVVGNDRYEVLAEKNRVRTVPMLAPRGKILDREGRILVDNYPSFSVLLLRDQVRTLDGDIEKIAAGLNMSAADIRERVRRVSFMPGYQPIVLKDDITPDELAFIEAHKNELPELELIRVHRRLYPKNGFLAHVIGYVGEVNEDMLNNPRFELYEPGMIVGQSGVEQQYNDLLMGKDGERRVVVNSKGKEMDRLSETPAIPGKQLKLTIDLDLQIAAEQALGDRNGAIVAMDPHTGEILAMASRPTFDPNDFAVRVSRQEWNRLVTDPNHPLMNKAIQAQLAPGSTFKIIESVAGLQEGVAQDLRVVCTGGATFYGRRFACHLKSGHGATDLTRGIYQSCDVFFYNLAERLGIGRIAKYATQFGIGKKTGVDLPGEVTGLMPSEEWKIKQYKQKWYAGETISVGIGQGAITVTPMQLVRAYGGISTGGELRRPHLVFDDEVPQAQLELISKTYPAEMKLEIAPENWERITDAMSQVPSPVGTAPSAQLPGIDFAGKTGSAQTMSNALAQKLGHSHSVNDNSWFVGFTPRRNPDVVVGVLFEGGEHGQFAARLAAQVIKAYVDKKKTLDLQRQQKSAELQTPPTPAQVPSSIVPPANAAVGAQGFSPANKPPEKGGALAPVQPAEKPAPKPTATLDITGMWTEPGADHAQAGRFRVQLPPAVLLPAKAAPGILTTDH
jgi:penicillin-binding protein 2